MHANEIKRQRGKRTINRKRLFDRRRYKHIGWYICDDPELDIDTQTIEGIKTLIANCMMTPYMEYDLKQGAFLLAEYYDISNDNLDMVVYTYNRYETGFAENMEYYRFRPSDRIFVEIDDAIHKEWVSLLERIHVQSC